MTDVSIILPFYRAGGFIREAIESVLQQRNFDTWTLCLVNDGSDDHDTDIARHFCRRYPAKIQLLAHVGNARRGTSASRNLAIYRTASEWIAFLDADDTWYPEKLHSQMTILSTQNTADMIYGPALRWYSWNGGTDLQVPVSVEGFGADCLVPGEALLATFLRDEAQTPCTGSVIIRRKAVERAGYFEESFTGLYDDQVFYSKLCRFAQVYVSSECVSRYRQHAASCCRQAESGAIAGGLRTEFLSWLRKYEDAHGFAHTEPALPPR